jgi:hypothetical protein
MTHNLSEKSDSEIRSWIQNHEQRGATGTELYRELVEEEGRRRGKGLKPDLSINALIGSARARRFISYGALADASGVTWNQARHRMNGAGGHLDQLLSICHARKLPLLPALCVNQEGLRTGTLSEVALAGFAKGAERLGYAVTDREAFLRKCQQECFDWGTTAQGKSQI